MTNYNEQIQRIKNKLPLAKKADSKLEVFGADTHKYHLNAPATSSEVLAFEKKYSITLPDCYKSFITQVGNGGISYANSAAGSFYGIYPLGEYIDELIYDNTEKYLKNDCMIYPKISNEDWQSLTKEINKNDNISDEEHEKELGKIYGGILPIGSQGCTYLHGIILNGKYKGRVVNLDADNQKPQFTFEANFLDWYERWLDEVISGDLITDAPSWFGYNKGGSEERLLADYIAAHDWSEKEDSLFGLFNKNKLKEATLNQIETLIDTNIEHKSWLVQLICKSNYEKAKPHLAGLVHTDLLAFFQFIFWYAKDKSNDWLAIINDNISKISNSETLKFCVYLLQATNSDYGNLILPFTKSKDEGLRIQAFYSLGNLESKNAFIDYFIEGLKDHSKNVVLYTLQALSGCKDKKLLPYYKSIAQQYKDDQDYILSNLNNRLADYGLTNISILEKDIHDIS